VEDDFKRLPLGDLVEPWIALRPIRRASVEYLELKDALDREGLLSSISVRPSPRLPGKYEIITGRYRHAVAEELGWDTIPCIIKHGITDEKVLALQIQENAIRPTTKPIEFSQQLQRIFNRQPDMTIAELARSVGKCDTWIKDRLSLLKLPKDVQVMVDRGEIPIGSAYMLAKIPSTLRMGYVSHAQTMKSKDFTAMAAGVIKQFAECVHQGKMDDRYMPKYEPTAHLRSIKEIKAELERPETGALIMAAAGCRSLTDAWIACLKWAIHMDRESIEEQARVANTRYKRQAKNEVQDAPLDD
jgi:ParB/RepB/Spo0J family partition protein